MPVDQAQQLRLYCTVHTHTRSRRGGCEGLSCSAASHVLPPCRADYACVSWMDSQVGRVLDTLKSEGMENDTLVILHADHGWHLGELGHWQKYAGKPGVGEQEQRPAGARGAC